MHCNFKFVAFLSGAALLIGGAGELQARPAGGVGGVGRGGGYRQGGYSPGTYRSPMPRTPTYNPGVARPISKPVVNNQVTRPIVRPISRPVTPAVNNLAVNNFNRINPNRPPGWDWWRIYPWSPYNAWRNPYWYWPYNSYYSSWYYPYPFIDSYTYPAYGAGYGYGSAVDPATYYGVRGNAAQPQAAQSKPEAPLPIPTGELKVPPANGAIIQLRGLDGFTPVRFNGQEVASVGSTRFYVLELAPGSNYNYTITAVVNHNGQARSEERRIDVTAGDVIMIDFGAANVAKK